MRRPARRQAPVAAAQASGATNVSGVADKAKPDWTGRWEVHQRDGAAQPPVHGQQRPAGHGLRAPLPACARRLLATLEGLRCRLPQVTTRCHVWSTQPSTSSRSSRS